MYWRLFGGTSAPVSPFMCIEVLSHESRVTECMTSNHSSIRSDRHIDLQEDGGGGQRAEEGSYIMVYRFYGADRGKNNAQGRLKLRGRLYDVDDLIEINGYVLIKCVILRNCRQVILVS